MRRPGPLPESLRAGGFTVAEARQHGVTRARTRAGDLHTPFYGVRAQFSTDDLRSRAVAYAARMPAGQFFSHTTAAQLNGLRMPDGLRETGLHVTSLAPSRAPRGVASSDTEPSRRPSPRRMASRCCLRSRPGAG